jgi:hypothetical protein
MSLSGVLTMYKTKCSALRLLALLCLMITLPVEAKGEARKDKHKPIPPSTTSAKGINTIIDGSFEAGVENPHWVSTSTFFGTVLCSEFSCGFGEGTAGPRTGSIWAWFGGIGEGETGTLAQQLTLHSGYSATLEFYLWIGARDPNGTDYLKLELGEVEIFNVLESSSTYYNGYTRVSIDVSAFADGVERTLRFTGVDLAAPVTNINVDDIQLIVTPVTPTATSTPTDQPTFTPVPPTATHTPTDEPTLTSVPPTDEPTLTPVPPTATSTPTDEPTFTPVPPTDEPTLTPEPPTATSTPTDEPTFTPVPPTDEPTLTPVPPTATSTPTDAPTFTPVPPTDEPTLTPEPPTATSTPTDAPTLTPTAPSSSVELLTNGGFEVLGSTQKPDITPWSLKNPSSDKAKCNKPGKLIAYEGNCAFMFRGGAAENSKLKQNAAVSGLSFNAGDRLDLRLYLNTTTSVAQGKLKLRVKYADGTEKGKVTLTLGPTSGYVPIHDSYTLQSSQVAKIKVQIDHQSPTGKVFVDAVSLRW